MRSSERQAFETGLLYGISKSSISTSNISLALSGVEPLYIEGGFGGARIELLRKESIIIIRPDRLIRPRFSPFPLLWTPSPSLASRVT